MKFIESWKSGWRWWSVKLNAIGLFIMGFLWFDPTAVLYVVNLMPPGVRHALPGNLDVIIGGLFFGLAMISRLIAQPKTRRKIAEKSNVAI